MKDYWSDGKGRKRYYWNQRRVQMIEQRKRKYEVWAWMIEAEERRREEETVIGAWRMIEDERRTLKEETQNLQETSTENKDWIAYHEESSQPLTREDRDQIQ
mgnify:CR=1 FL=1